MSGVFTVTMLDALREDFEAWLAGRGLVIAEISDEAGALIVIPEAFGAADNRAADLDIGPEAGE